LKERGLETNDFDTIYLWKPNIYYLIKSDAILKIAKIIGGKYSALSVFKIFPRFSETSATTSFLKTERK
jgi:predicted DCC family thiol-disulfide oxidoreductase YuxK